MLARVAETVVIESRFRGPPDSGNGGYTCGLLAALVGEPAEVTLRLPPPLDVPMRFEDGRLLAGDRVVAEARRVDGVDLDVPAPPSREDAARASERYAGFDEHAFPTCFVCGPAREDGDGLRIFAGPLGDGRVAAPWTPRESRRELAWASLDCPGAFAAGFSGRGDLLLGRLTGEVLRVPEVGEACVVVGWPLGRDGRKRYAGTALFGEGGELLGQARATWISPRTGSEGD
jgi:hypothetical protein